MFDTITVPLGRDACYGSLSVETDKLPEHVIRFLFEYGLRQNLNDAIANKYDDDKKLLPRDAIVAKAEKRLATLLSGELRATRAGVETDAKTQIVFNLLKEDLLTMWRHAGIFGPFPAKTRNRFLYCGNKLRAAKGKSTFENEIDFITAVLDENPATKARLEKRAQEILDERENLGIEI